MKKELLLLSTRSFGDAIIVNSFAKVLAEKYNVTVFTKKEFQSIYKKNEAILNIEVAEFPMGANATINIFPLLMRICVLRKRHFDVAVDIMGDFRERLVLSCISSSQLLSVERENGHPFNNLIRRGLKKFIEPIFIPKTMINFYSQINYVASKLGCNIIEDNKSADDRGKAKIIGIHPFASQKCKMWNWSSWNSLINILIKEGYEVLVFGSPKQKNVLENEVKLKNKVHISCNDIEKFLLIMKQCKCIICLDSFAFHAAYYMRVPSVMINGGNVYEMWKTPLSIVVNNPKKYSCWPCYNKPKCKDNKCISTIETDFVWKKIKESGYIELNGK